MPKIHYFSKILLSCTKATNSYPENHPNPNVPDAHSLQLLALLLALPPWRSVRVESIPRVRVEMGRETLPSPRHSSQWCTADSCQERGGMALSQQVQPDNGVPARVPAQRPDTLMLASGRLCSCLWCGTMPPLSAECTFRYILTP